MIFLKPANQRIDFTFTPSQRAQLREAVMRWIESPEFDTYFRSIHLLRREALRDFLLEVPLAKGSSGLRLLLQKLRSCGIATRRLRKGYLELARHGEVAWGMALAVPEDLRNGKNTRAKVRVQVAAEATPEADKHNIEIYHKLANSVRSSSKSAAFMEMKAFAEDPAFVLFRVRQVPEAFAGKAPLYWLDVVLHHSVNPGDPSAFCNLLCVLNLDMRPSLLGIPADLVRRTIKAPTVPIRADRSLCA